MIRFDTRDKKPKLHELLPVTALVIVLTLLLGKEGQAHLRLICGILGAYYMMVILRLLFAFRGQLQYNPSS